MLFQSGTEEEVIPLATAFEEFPEKFPKEFCISVIALMEKKQLYSFNAKDSHNPVRGFEHFRQLNLAGFVTQLKVVYWALQMLDLGSLAKTSQSKFFSHFEHQIWISIQIIPIVQIGISIHNTLNIYLYFL